MVIWFMIYIVAGDIDSGKTARMFNLYQKMRPEEADGFISPKVYQDGCFRGYEIVRLSNGEKRVLAGLAGAGAPEFTDYFQYDRFLFSREGFQFGETLLRNLLKDAAIKNVFIDEIGPLELQGLGFHDILLEALQSSRDIYLCLRSSCLESVLTRFAITDYKLV